MLIRVIDFETTGEKPPEAEVCEVGWFDIRDGKALSRCSASWLCFVDKMPPAARAVHHISLGECGGYDRFSPDMVDDPFAEVDVFAAHNADFEKQFFQTGKPWICTYKVALRQWPDAPSHSNNALRYWLEDEGKIRPLDRDLAEPAHRAGPDAYVTAHLLLALMAEGLSVETMIQWSAEPRVLPRCTIGKFRGQPWANVEDGFLAWMTRQADMEADLKWNAAREIERRQNLAFNL